MTASVGNYCVALARIGDGKVEKVDADIGEGTLPCILAVVHHHIVFEL